MRIDIGSGYSIQDETHGFSLVTMVGVREKKGRGDSPMKLDDDGNAVQKESKAYYSTVYQALQGYLNAVVGLADSLEKIPVMVRHAMTTIREAEQEIKDSFRIEVMVYGRRGEKSEPEAPTGED